jgi:hypothetical protein
VINPPQVLVTGARRRAGAPGSGLRKDPLGRLSALGDRSAGHKGGKK